MSVDQYDPAILNLARGISATVTSAQSDSFSFYANQALIDDLALAMARRVRSLGISSLDMAPIKNAWESCDFMLVAELFDHLISLPNEHPDWIGKALHGDGVCLYQHQMARFIRQYGDAAPQKYTRAYDLPAIFDAQNSQYLVYWSQEPEEQYLRLLDEARWRLNDLVSMQADLPGTNSLVRTGLVKSLFLPNGERIVAKRDNPDKPGRFVNEQINVAEIIARLDLPRRDSCSRITDRGLAIRVVRPFAVLADRAANVLYSLSHYEGHPTLETILLREKDGAVRRRYLAKVRQVLEHLYEKGIVWGDMAPRNILVSTDKDETTFYLLDFEKTAFTSGAVPMAQRLEHTRGPMCVEEFGAVCTLPEVVECFFGYFDPAAWPCDDAGNIPYAKPKREVIDILAAKGNFRPTFGAYNSTEREMLGVRFPFKGKDGVTRLPLHTSFKIDHYLGAEYDRKTTQLFMDARECGLLEGVVDALNAVLLRLENRLVFEQFTARLLEPDGGARTTTRSAKLLHDLAAAIDQLYGCPKDQNKLLLALTRLEIGERFHQVRAQCKLHSPDKHIEARLNWAIVEPALREFADRQPTTKSLVALYGGGARGHFSGGSDLDIAVISADGDRDEAIRLEREFVQFAQDSLGLSVELFPPLSLETLEEFIRRQPDCFLDFSCGVVLCAPEALSTKYQEIVARSLTDRQYLDAVRAHYSTTLSRGTTVKDMLKLVLVASALGIDCHIALYGALQAAKCAEALGNEDGFAATGADRQWIVAQLAILEEKIAARIS